MARHPSRRPRRRQYVAELENLRPSLANARRRRARSPPPLELTLRTTHNRPIPPAALRRRDLRQVQDLQERIQRGRVSGMTVFELEELDDQIDDIRTQQEARQSQLDEIDAQRWWRREYTSGCWNFSGEPDWGLTRQEMREIRREEDEELRLEAEDREAARVEQEQAELRQNLLDQLHTLSLTAPRSPPLIAPIRPPLPLPPRVTPPRPGQAMFNRLGRRLERALRDNNQEEVQELTTSITDLRSHLREGLEAWELEYNRGAGHLSHRSAEEPLSPTYRSESDEDHSEVDQPHEDPLDENPLDENQPHEDVDLDQQVARLIENVVHPNARSLPAEAVNRPPPTLLPAVELGSSLRPTSSAIANHGSGDWAQVLEFQPSRSGGPARRSQPRSRRSATPGPSSAGAHAPTRSLNIRPSTPRSQQTSPSMASGQALTRQSPCLVVERDVSSRSTPVQRPIRTPPPRDPVTGRFISRGRILSTPYQESGSSTILSRSRSPPSEAEANRPSSRRRTRD